MSADDLALYLRVDDDLDDAELAFACSGASRAVDEHCHRQFGQVAAPEVRYYTPRWSKSRQGWLLPVDDFQTVAGLSVTLDLIGDGSYTGLIDPAYLVKLPVNAAMRGRPWEALLIRYASPVKPNQAYGEMGVLAQWGWTTTPSTVKLAAKLQASRFDFRRGAPAGIAGSPEQGSETRLLAKLDPDVAVALRSYRRLWKVGMFG